MIGAGLLYGLTKGLAGWTAGLIQPHIYRLDTVTLLLIGLVWTLIEGLLVALYLLSQGRTAVWDHYAALALPLGMAHAILLAIAYAILHRLPAPERSEPGALPGRGAA
jgi:threonine/homoserine efflux transporter RhtA